MNIHFCTLQRSTVHLFTIKTLNCVGNQFSNYAGNNRVMRLHFTIAIVVLFCVSSFGQKGSILYSFFVAGHTYGKPGVDNVGFHPPFKQKFEYIQNRPEIKFGVLTGDIVITSTIQNWDEIDDDVDSLGLPVYFAVGNHDMTDRNLFESRYGSTYYSFLFQNDLFIVLDPNIDEWSIAGSQLLFLQNVITDYSSTVNNINVFFHQILWKEADTDFSYILWNSSAGRGVSVNFWTEVAPLFCDLSNKVFMFAGDLGASWASDVTYDKYDNLTLIATGMGDDDNENFIVVNVAPNKSVDYDLICLSDTNMSCLGELTDHLMVNVQNAHPSIAYPNPASSYINIVCNGKSKTIFQLFSMQGELLLEETYLDNKTTHTIYLDQIPRSMYLARIISDGKQSTSKLILE